MKTCVIEMADTIKEGNSRWFLRWIFEGMSSFVWFLSLVALLGYATHNHEFVDNWWKDSNSGMSLQTAIGLFLLSSVQLFSKKCNGAYEQTPPSNR